VLPAPLAELLDFHAVRMGPLVLRGGVVAALALKRFSEGKNVALRTEKISGTLDALGANKHTRIR